MIAGLLKAASSTGAIVKATKNTVTRSGKGKGGGLTKKVKTDKFIATKKDGIKGSSIVKAKSLSISTRPKSALVPKVSGNTVETKGTGGFDYLKKIVDALLKNIKNLLDSSKSEYKNQLKVSEVERRNEQLQKKKDKEIETESKVEEKEDKKRGPSPIKSPLFGGAFEMLKRFAIGTGVMYAISILSDPKKKDSLIGFLTENVELLVLGLVGGMGAMLAASVLPLVSAFIPVLTITSSILGSLVSLILSPPVLFAVLTYLGANAVRNTFYNNVMPAITPFVQSMINANQKRRYGAANAKKGAMITKIRDQYGRNASREDYDKMTNDEKKTAEFLKMYDEELEKRQKLSNELQSQNNRQGWFQNKQRIKELEQEIKASDAKISTLENQIKVQGIPLREFLDMFEKNTILPETSLGKRLYPHARQHKFDAPQPSTPLVPQATTPGEPQAAPPGTPPRGATPGQTIVHGKPELTSNYGVWRGNKAHGGTDIAADSGALLTAVSDGQIIDYGSLSESGAHRGDPSGWGNFVVYRDDKGYTHLYGHILDGGILKKSGNVRKGEPIGKVGSTGGSSGPHLHWEIGSGWNGATINGKFDPLSIYALKDPFTEIKYTAGAPRGATVGQPTQFASAKPAGASGVSQFASYEGLVKPKVTPVPILMQNNQPQGSSGGGGLVQSGSSKSGSVNSYYNTNTLGFLYKQG